MKICICSNDANTMQILWHSLIAYSCTVNMEFELIRENTQNLIAHESFPFDILFIDAASHASLDGIEKVGALRKAGVDAFIVVIATDDIQIAAQAYSAEVSAYLIKPFNKSQVNHVLDDFMARIKRVNDRHNRILVLCLDGLQVIHTTDLAAVITEPSNRHRILSLAGENKETTEALADLYSKLPNNHFVYAHRSYIVNLEYVDKFDNDSITLSNGMDIPLGRVYRDGFIKALQLWCGRRSE